MKNIYESILSSVKAGKQALLEDPELFAKEYLKLNDRQYFVSKGFLFIVNFPQKTFVIDKDFPDIKFKISQVGCVNNSHIIIKDISVFNKYFGTMWGTPVKIGYHILNTKSTTYIQDPEFVSTSPNDFSQMFEIEGNLVIDKAKRINWAKFPDIDGDITINAKNIKELYLPVMDRTNIIKIKR